MHTVPANFLQNFHRLYEHWSQAGPVLHGGDGGVPDGGGLYRIAVGRALLIGNLVFQAMRSMAGRSAPSG